MHVIQALNVNDALPQGLRYLGREGSYADSRAGPAIAAPGPVTTVYARPWECVLFSPLREANPFFHLCEGALWMLAGRDDAAFLTPYVKTFDRFAEPDGRIHGAYGYRWREGLGLDQLEFIVRKLRADPGTRQAVLQMWDGRDPDGGFDDLTGNFADRPCNTHAYLRVRDGRLDMTVCCRSNDIIMGAYGANAVHFAFLQQYVAGRVGVPAGRYWQVSSDYHAYVRDVEMLGRRAGVGTPAAPFDIFNTIDRGRLIDAVGYGPLVYPGTLPLVSDPETFDEELRQVVEQVDEFHAGGDPGAIDPAAAEVDNPFLSETVLQALKAHAFYRAGDSDRAHIHARMIAAPDWREACSAWISRRAARKNQKTQEEK